MSWRTLSRWSLIGGMGLSLALVGACYDDNGGGGGGTQDSGTDGGRTPGDPPPEDTGPGTTDWLWKTGTPDPDAGILFLAFAFATPGVDWFGADTLTFWDPEYLRDLRATHVLEVVKLERDLIVEGQLS